MMCCLMRYLLKMLSDMLQSPQLLSHIHICPKPKVKLDPIEISYPAPVGVKAGGSRVGGPELCV